MSQQVQNLTKNTPQEDNNPPTLSSNQNAIKLLQFNEKFIGAVHSSVYKHQQITQDIIVQFQIKYITDLNEVWGKMVSQLMQGLIQKKIPYQNTLKDYFHKLFSLDYLSLLRINRYELTQLSLYGFDIYVPPLTAILQIINRMDGIKHNIQTSINNLQISQKDEFQYKPIEIWESLKQGWKNFVYYSNLWKISLNIYLLREYLKIGAKSLIKKDKQIVFTGCNNIFTNLVPLLKSQKQIWLLCQLAELSNDLYIFHPSYQYSYFFTLMLPLKNEYECIFSCIKYVAEKCMNTYILTPLLFAVLRNRESFLNFIEQIDSEIWVDYLNGLAYGLLINFKARILQYQQVLNIFKAVVSKLGILSSLNIQSYLRGELQKQWQQARQFFISALKVGYNFGELQTWHSVTQQQIQTQILESVRESLLLHDEISTDFKKIMPQQGYKQFIQDELKKLIGCKVTFQQFTTSYNDHILKQIKENKIDSFEKTEIILRIVKLMTLSKCDQNCIWISYVFGILSLINLQHEGKNYQIYQKRLSKITRYLIEQSKQLVIKKDSDIFHIKQLIISKPIKLINDPIDIFPVVQLILYLSSPRQGLHKIFKIVEQLRDRSIQIPQNLDKWLASNIIGLYNCQINHQTNQNLITMNTFTKEYKVPRQIINFNSKMHSCVNYLVQKTIFNHSQLSLNTLLQICRIKKWLSVPLLNFPVCFSYETEQKQKQNLKKSIMFEENQNNAYNHNKLEAFSVWFIQSNEESQRKALKQLIYNSINNEYNWHNKTQYPVKQYVEEISIVVIYEQIVNYINSQYQKVTQLQDKQLYVKILDSLMLLSKLISQNKTNQQIISINFQKRMLKMFLRIYDGVQSMIIISNQQNNQSNNFLIQKLVNSLSVIYLNLLQRIYSKNESDDMKIWLLYMKNLCTISLAPAVEGIQKNSYAYHKEYQLPSIRNESSLLVKNSMDYMKQLNYPQSKDVSLNQKQIQIKQLYGKDTQSTKFEEKQQCIINLLDLTIITQVTLEYISQKHLSKQFLLPSLSSDTISLLIDYALQNNREQPVLLAALNPANHIKVTEICIDKIYNSSEPYKIFNIIMKIGITRQIVNYDAKMLFKVLQNHEKASTIQISKYCCSLDKNAKKILSDSFLLSSIKQTQQKSNHLLNLMLFEPSLNFLLVNNQSNWRNLIDRLCKFFSGEVKHGNKLSNNYSNYSGPSISSIILQYLEYIRITKDSNKQYEQKIGQYAQNLQAYSKLLIVKFEYLSRLEQQLRSKGEQSMYSKNSSEQMRQSQMSGFDSLNKDSSISEVSRRTKTTLQVQNNISEEELQLNFSNQVANIRLLMEYCKFKDVLKRISFFKKQLDLLFNKNTEQLVKYSNIIQILDNRIVKSFLQINKISNQISKGPLVLPDFLKTYQLCSFNCYSINKIQLGCALQEYFDDLQQQLPKQYIYSMQYGTPISLAEFIRIYCQQFNQNTKFPAQILLTDTKLTKQQQKSVNQRYQSIKQKLMNFKIIEQSQGKLQILGLKQDNQQNRQVPQEKLLPFFGLFSSSSSDTFCSLISKLFNRNKLSFEDLKKYHVENYHFIKSIVIDDDQSLIKRQMNFTLKGKQLIKGGKDIKVNANNKLMYCNLVGVQSLSAVRLRRIWQLVRGKINNK